jgi:hypothetical protein
MAIIIQITEETETNIEMGEVLHMIADLVEDGHTSGHDPDWCLADTIDCE